MKIERLSENQIRCTLNKSDLASRQLKISELAYGSDKARELFHDMMQQASYEVGFEADNIPLMIEAIPVSTECIVLIVTKVENPDELDTRFSRFSPSDRDSDDYDDDYDDEYYQDMESIGQDYEDPPTACEELNDCDTDDDIANLKPPTIGEFLESDLLDLFSKVRDYLNNNIPSPGSNSDDTTIKSTATGDSVTVVDSERDNSNTIGIDELPALCDNLVDKISDENLDKFIPLGKSLGDAAKSALSAETLNSTSSTKLQHTTRIYSFNSLIEVASAARSVIPVFTGSSALYKDKEAKYYLVIDNVNCNSVNFNKTCNILTEYGEKLHSNKAAAYFLKEHVNCLIKTDAVKILSTL